MDLTPRTTTDAPRRRRRNWPAVSLLAVALIGVAVVLFEGLSSATSYYCNADEVGVKSGCSGDKRFRLQGTVEPGTITRDGDSTDFLVTFNGRTVRVHHSGDLQEMFAAGIPVVVEGNLSSTSAGSDPTFDSDQMMIKHSEKYRADNPDRVSPTGP